MTALWLAAAVGCSPQAPKTASSPSSAATRRGRTPPLVFKITGRGTAARPVHFFKQTHNRVDYDLLASSYESKGPQGDQRAVFQNARVTFRDPHGAAIAASAPQAVVDQAADTVTLRDGVHAHASSGMTLTCTELVYRRAAGTLHGSGDVVITDPKGFRATGSSFDSDISLTHIRMQ